MKTEQANLEFDSLRDSREYKALVRSLKRRKGFGLLFVECSPAAGERLIEDVKGDVAQKNVEVLRLEKAVVRVYDLVADILNGRAIDILFIMGLESSFYEYESLKRQKGWGSKDIYSYSWKGVPPILDHLNQQRENFRDNFDVCFVFLVPRFVVNYFIRRAPDFFDWRSGLFRLSIENDKISNSTISPITLPLCGNFLIVGNNAAINIESDVYDRSLKITEPDNQVWYKKGNEFKNLGKYEKAIAAYDRALQKQPEDSYAWNEKGDALKNLGRYEEAISAYTQALKIKIKNNKDKKYELCYKKASCYALLGNADMALTNLQLVIDLGGIKALELAKTDTDFDSLRESDRFQELINKQKD